MASEAISVAVLVVAGIVVASMVASAIFSQVYTMQSLSRLAMKASEERLKTAIEIVYGAINSSGNNVYLVLFIKNVGVRTIPLEELERSDVYTGSGSCNNVFLFSTSEAPGSWGYRLIDLNNDGFWSPGETVIINVHNTTILTQPICARVVLPNGVGDEEYIYS